jgi:hypothetical protein
MFGYQDETKESLLSYLIEGGDLSRYGLLNAITRTAQDQEWDRGVQMEKDAAEIVELSKSEWESLASKN